MLNSMKTCENCRREFKPHRNSNRYCSYRCSGLARSRAFDPQLKEEYFKDIDTPEKAYWLGFILADGNICRSDEYSLKFTLCLARRDESHLEEFMRVIGASKKSYRTSGKSKQVALIISNKVFCEHLVAAGCIPRKSKVLRFPTIKDRRLQLAILLGMFDGDGSLCGPRRDCPLLSSGSRALMEDIKALFQLDYKIQRDRITLGKPLLKAMTEAYRGGLLRKRLPGTLEPKAGE